MFLDHLMVHRKEFPISLIMELLTGHPMGHVLELLMENLMDRSMDRTINPMGTGINNLLTLLIMYLEHRIVKVHHIIMIPCNTTQVKWEEDIMAKAMVFILIILI